MCSKGLEVWPDDGDGWKENVAKVIVVGEHERHSMSAMMLAVLITLWRWKTDIWERVELRTRDTHTSSQWTNRKPQVKVKLLCVWSTADTCCTIYNALTAFHQALIRQYETMTHPVFAWEHESTRVQRWRLISQVAYVKLLILASTQISKLRD